jgi:hypothetical protein
MPRSCGGLRITIELSEAAAAEPKLASFSATLGICDADATAVMYGCDDRSGRFSNPEL